MSVSELYYPASIRLPSRMFPGEKQDQWEPVKVREKEKAKDGISATNGVSATNGAIPTSDKSATLLQASEHEEPIFEEDPLSEEGAVYPLKNGHITNWSCFYALLEYVYNKASPPFHTAVVLVSQPAWTIKDKENITQFMFEKFKIPAFCMMDAAVGAQYAYTPTSCLVINVGYDKADITAISDFAISELGRGIALEGCGGQAMTENLHRLLGPKGFTYDMCEQLKRSNICEVLPPNVPLPNEDKMNPAVAATTGVGTATPGQKGIVGQSGLPRGPGIGTEVGSEFDVKDADDNDGVLDVASIVASGKTSEFLAKKDREKAEKVASKKSAAEAAATAKITKLPNSQRAKVTFQYEERKSPEEATSVGQKPIEVSSAVVEGEVPTEQISEMALSRKEERRRARDGGSLFVRKEIEVGIERFQAFSADMMLRICDAAHRCVLGVEVTKRADVWDNVIILGQGSKVKGKDIQISKFPLSNYKNLTNATYRFQRSSNGHPHSQIPHLPLFRNNIHFRTPL